MSQHHHDPIEDNIDTHPVKLAIGVVIGAVALIIAIILVVKLAVSSYGSREMKGEAVMSEKAVADRLAPVAKVSVDANAPSAPAAGAAAAPAAAMPAAAIPPAAPGKTADAGSSGKSTYDSACVACHGAGVAGAPKFGDKAAWAPRVAQGKATLHASALKGKGAMPPKGGQAQLPDEAVKAAVDYMVAAAK
ncbi:MAG TPA: c-type cytochrome [Usitatibacter sp.]|nr:c-type cytochrome [Usitatibacter sp.]